jgi:hypothetical protein
MLRNAVARLDGPPAPATGTMPGSGDTSVMEGLGADQPEPDDVQVPDDVEVPHDVQVPDDASSLEPERQAWLAERAAVRAADRAAHRRARRRRLLLTRRWERFGLSGPIVTLCLLATALVGALTVLFLPGLPEAAEPAALALVPAMTVPPTTVPPTTVPSTHTPAPGAVESSGPRLDHRLPSVRLVTRQGPRDSSELRPAVLVVPPPSCACLTSCACAPTIRALVRQARSFQITTWVVRRGTNRAGLEALDRRVGLGTTSWALDENGVLQRALGASGLTVTLVRDDGVVTAIRRDVSLDPEELPGLEPQLAALDRPDRS